MERDEYKKIISHYNKPKDYPISCNIIQCDKEGGLLFSGGIDSSIIAHCLKRKGIRTELVTVAFYDEGFKEPDDLIYARKSAKLLGMKLKEIVLTLEEVEKEIEETARIIGDDLIDVINIGVGVVEKIGIGYLSENFDHVYSGLGSEELFAGYERHEKAEDINEECYNGLVNLYDKDLLRTTRIAEHYHMKVIFPFITEELVSLSATIPPEKKIRDGFKKWCLRKAFENDIPKEIVWRKKKAAQYGSRIDSAIRKIARKNGFMNKRPYVMSLKR